MYGKTALITVIGLLVFSLFLTLPVNHSASGVETHSELDAPIERGVLEPFKPDTVALDDLESDTSDEISLPFSGFIENKGQKSNRSILFYYENQGSGIGFGVSHVALYQVQENTEPFFLSLSFPNANLVEPVGKKKKAHVLNYFYGDLHLSEVLSFDEVWFFDLYENIDLRYFMSEIGIKYEFIVHPGSDPSVIAIQPDSSVSLSVESHMVEMSRFDSSGFVFADTDLLVFQKDQNCIDASYVSTHSVANAYGFRISEYDTSQDLIIDPVYSLNYSSYLGGNERDVAHAIDIDSAGNIVVVGSTISTDFPTVNALNDTRNGLFDAFVLKLSPDGSTLLFSTYIGGSAHSDGAENVALDILNNIYITGFTSSTNFPTKNGYQMTHSGSSTDVFVMKLTAAGDDVVYSTFLGGDGADHGYGIAVNNSGYCIVSGNTISTDFPTLNAINSSKNGDHDIFLSQLNPSGNGLVFSTYLGGSLYERTNDLTLDSSDTIFMTGYTHSANFPTLNAYNATHSGGADVFVMKVSSSGTGILHSTFLGGSSTDYGQSIRIDTLGNMYISGETLSSNFPVHNAYQDSFGGVRDAFLLKLNTVGDALHYSTYFGGTLSDYGHALYVDAEGCVYLTGHTESSDLPTLNAYDNALDGVNDAYVAKFNSTGTGLNFSTYIGGGYNDHPFSIVLDDEGAVLIGGLTGSDDFPIKNGYIDTYGGGQYDVFISRFSLEYFWLRLETPKNGTLLKSGVMLELNVGDDKVGISVVRYNWDGSANTSISDPYQIAVPSGDGSHVLRVYAQNNDGLWLNGTYVFTVDDSNPSVILHSPVNNTSHFSGTTVNVSVSDIHLTTVLFRWDDAPSNYTFSAPYDTSIPIGAGLHHLHIYAYDMLESFTYSLFTFRCVDKIVLTFSTFFGGDSLETGNALSIDNSDNIIVTGWTHSSDFFTVNAYDSTPNPGADVYVSKLNSSATGFEFSTYFGGSGSDQVEDLAVDSSGNIYITGFTYSADFPRLNPYDSTLGGTIDAFAAKFDENGSLLFSTYIGGSSDDYGYGITAFDDGASAITGVTYSADYPTHTALDNIFNGSYDGFITKFNSTGNGLVFSSYIGGESGDECRDIAVDLAGNLYLTGFTKSSLFPTKNAFQTQYEGFQDIFILKLNSSGSGLEYATYLGGTNTDEGHALSVDNGGNCYVTGRTFSEDFPLVNPYDDIGDSMDGDIFVTKLNPQGDGLEYSTYIGTGQEDFGGDIALDSTGRACILGYTRSNSYPTYQAYDESRQGGDEVVLTMLNSSGNGLEFSTYYGGIGDDLGFGVDIQSNGDIYFMGYTYSPDLPLEKELDSTIQGNAAFIGCFHFDNEGPNITLYSPPEAVYESGTDIFVNVTEEFFDIESVLANWDGNENITLLEPYNTALPIGDGIHTLVVYSNDSVGNWFSREFSFTTDDSPPNLGDLSPLLIDKHDTGVYVTWNPNDAHPASYRLFNETALLRNGIWNSSSESISCNIDGLMIGDYTFTLEVTDSLGHSANGTIIVLVRDLISPVITPAPDTGYEAGSLGHIVTWACFEEYPLSFEVYIDSDLSYSGDWNGSDIIVDIDGLDPGEHNITILFTDEYGNTADDMVLVTVVDTTAPLIAPPPDHMYLQGVIGNEIVWVSEELYPYRYEVLQDDSFLRSGGWIGSPIVVIVDGLLPGEYNFTLILEDESGNTAVDSVLVTVLVSTTITTPTTTTTPTTITTTTVPTTNITGFPDIEGIVGPLSIGLIIVGGIAVVSLVISILLLRTTAMKGKEGT